MQTKRTDGIARLKKAIRAQIVQATARGAIDGHDALAILMVLGAEMVAKVNDPDVRAQFVSDVVDNFPAAVDLERMLPPNPGQKLH